MSPTTLFSPIKTDSDLVESLYRSREKPLLHLPSRESKLHDDKHTASGESRILFTGHSIIDKALSRIHMASLELLGFRFLVSGFKLETLGGLAIGRESLPWAIEVKLAELLGQLHGLGHHPLHLIIIA